MAERRMFSKNIVMSDDFLDLELSARALYLAIGMLADDEGFINNPRSVIRQCGASMSDLDALVSAGFLIRFDSGVIAVKHWLANNVIRADRKTESACIERELVEADKTGTYNLNSTPCGASSSCDEDPAADFQPENDTPPRVVNHNLTPCGASSSCDEDPACADKVRLDKVSLDNNIPCPAANAADGTHESVTRVCADVIAYLNDKTGQHYRPDAKETQTLIRARLKTFAPEDLKTVIDKMAAYWSGTEMEQYLRPSTLFSPQKFESYLNGTYRGKYTPRGASGAKQYNPDGTYTQNGQLYGATGQKIKSAEVPSWFKPITEGDVP